MTSRFLFLAGIAIACLGVHAAPFSKRANYASLFDGKNPLQGVEVNGLFNPMESITPQLFERASEEHGSKLNTYLDICKLLPQDKLDTIMADHYNTFITDYDLETLKNAHIHSVRIPVSYNVFLPETNRTDNFPHGEKKALDTFIQRVLDYDMTIWLDLIATPNNHLGQLEIHGNEITPEIAKKAIKAISKKYDSRDVTTVLVHPDITYPSKPSDLSPLETKSIKKTKTSQYTLYKDLSSILAKTGHLLAIDTTKNLEYWARTATTFSEPLVLVHSLQTGLVSTRQRSAQRLMKSIKEDLTYLRDVAKDTPVAVTWDASVNSCLEEGQSDCSIEGQLWQAMDSEPESSDDDGDLNDYTENFGLDVLEELDKSNIAAWFFRTAKIQSDVNALDAHELRKLKKRARRPEQVISGNDFLGMYRHGMFTKKTFQEGRGHKKGVAPVVLGLGAAAAAGGAGALGWWFWDDIKKGVSDLASSFTPSKMESGVKKPVVQPDAGRSSAVHIPSLRKINRPQTEDVSRESVEVVVTGSGPSSSPDGSGSSSSHSYPGYPPDVATVPADPPILPEPISEPFDFPFSQSPELDYNDDNSEIIPVQPYRNPNRQRQPEAVADEDSQDSSKHGKRPFSDPAIFQEGLKGLKHFNPPPSSPEKPEVVPDSLEVDVKEPSVDSELFEPISPVGEYVTDYVPSTLDFSVERAPHGTIDKAHLPALNEILQNLEDPKEPEKPPPTVEIDIPHDGSVRESISRIESLSNSPDVSRDASRRSSRVFDDSPLDSKRSSYSEFGLSKGVQPYERQFLRTVSEIEADLIALKVPKEQWTKPLNIPRKRPLSMNRDVGDRRHGKVVSVEEKDLLDKMMLDNMRQEQKEESISQSESISKAGSTNALDGSQEQIPASSRTSAIIPEEPESFESDQEDKRYNPEPLTHVQQERYTRPHAGTGGASPVITEQLTKVRKDTDIKRRASPEPSITLPNLPKGHHVIVGEHARPMEVHAPRHKDMDPNHPQNLKKMKLKSDEYIPYPPPEAKHTIHTHHITTEKVKTKGKTPFALPKTVVTHHKEEKHLHPDMAAAWQKVGHQVPDAPKSGLGKDPRKDFEDAHWTEAQKAGHRAYVEAVQKKDQVKSEVGSPGSGKVSKLAEKWRENAAGELNKGPAFRPPVDNKGNEGRVKNLAHKWTKGDNDKQPVETSKPSAKSPRSSKVSELANKFAAEASYQGKSTSAELSRLEKAPGKVSRMAKLWTDMERKATEDTSRDSVFEHAKSLEETSIPADQKAPGEAAPEVSNPVYLQEPKEGVKEKVPSKHDSVEERLRRVEEDIQKSLPNPNTNTKTPQTYQEYLVERRKRRAKLGLPPSSRAYGRDAETQSSHPQLTHLTRDRVRQPKKSTSLDA